MSELPREAGMQATEAYRSVQHNDAERLILEHTPLVKRIAYHLVARLPQSVQVDDLIQAGAIGLIEAARNFDDSQGASFETYAGIRIRGAMLDEIRKSDWIPRSVRRRMRELNDVLQKLEQQKGRPATAEEVARALKMDMEEYTQFVNETVALPLVSLDELLGERPEKPVAGQGENLSEKDPLAMLEDTGFHQALAEMIDRLPEREKLVMGLYYDEGLNLKEIGMVLEVSESRVCQIHAQALARLRTRMRDWVD